MTSIEGRTHRIRRWLPLLVFSVATMWFSVFACIDGTVAKNGITYLDEARHIRGDFALNDRETPSYHPLYSVLIAAARIPTVSWRTTGRIVSVVASSALVLFVWGWLRRTDSALAGWCGALLALTSAPLIYWSSDIMAEALALLLFTVATALVWEAGRRVTWRWTVGTGIVLGLFALARSEGILLMAYCVPPLALLLWRSTRSLRGVIVHVGGVLAVAGVCLIPHVVQLTPFNGRVSIYPDVRYRAWDSGLRRLPDAYWDQIDALPRGVPTTEQYVGIRGVEGLASKALYTIREYAKVLLSIDSKLASSMFTLIVLMLLALSVVPSARSDAVGDGAIAPYLWYLVGFGVVTVGLVVAAFDLGIDARRTVYLVPPVLMLAAMGAARLKDTVAASFALRGLPDRFARHVPTTLIAVVLAAHVMFASLSIGLHVSDTVQNSTRQRVVDESAEYIRSVTAPRAPVVASNDLMMAFAADGWYVPLRAIGGDPVAAARDHQADVVAVQSYWYPEGFEDLLNQRNIPEGLEFLREFGTLADVSVVVYRVDRAVGDVTPQSAP